MKNKLSTYKNTLRILLGLTVLLFIPDCQGWERDRVWTNNEQKTVVDVDLGRFPSYTKGSRITVNFNAEYSTVINYYFNLPKISAYDILIYEDSKYIMLPRKEGSWKRKINDDLNLISLEIDRTEYVSFNQYSYGKLQEAFIPPDYTGKELVNIPVKGSLTLELERDVIGGAVIAPVEIPLIYSYSAVAKSGMWPSDVDTSSIFNRIYLKTSGLIPAPVLCKINIPGGEHIDFGNVMTDSLTPARENENQQTIALDYRCNAQKTLPAKIHLLARNATFSDAVIASSNPAVGITLARNGTPLRPGATFPTRLQDGQGHDTLTAVVTRNPAVAPGDVDTGPFSASAILVIEQQ